MSARRVSPVRRPSRLLQGVLVLTLIAAGFFTLIVRLVVTREGYDLSALRVEIARLEDENRRLRLESAQLASHERLRALAPRYNLAPVTAQQVVRVR